MGFKSLSEWAREFVRHKDLFERKVERIEETPTGFKVLRKDKRVQDWRVADTLVVPGKSDDQVTIVCQNTKENVKATVKAWKALVTFPSMNILYVNLDSGEKWSLNPKVHDMIADPATLESGLLNLMDAANGVMKEEPKRKRKKQSMFEETSEDPEEGDPEN